MLEHIQIGIDFSTWQELYQQHPCEVVEGEIIWMSPLSRRHSTIANRLARFINDYALPQKLGEAFIETVFVLDGNRREQWVKGSRTPDVSFITQTRMTDYDADHSQDDEGEPWWLAPDIAIEIISPNDRYLDVIEKVRDYLKHKVKIVWVIETRSSIVRVFTPASPDGKTFQGEDILTADSVIPHWSIVTQTIFEIA
jgi:Uma2 family endonuclease